MHCMLHSRVTLLIFCLALAAGCATTQPPVDPSRLGQLVLENDTRLIAPADFSFTGSGTYIFPDGTQWSGNFLEGKLHGRGREDRAGTIYQGNYAHGKRHGNGTLTESSGLRYEGMWRDGERSGYGGQLFADGSKYEGDWHADAREGFGAFRTATGHEYEGQWLADKMHGYGAMRETNGVLYEGMWSQGVRAGVGRETRPDGSVYEGQFLQDQKHGEGVETHSDGTSHQGAWQEGHILGLGDRTTRAGLIFSGAWTRNLITFGMVTLPDGGQYAGDLFAAKGRGVSPDFVDWLSKEAANGSAYAQYFLALTYLDYAEPSRDLALAQVHLTSAANAGLSDAQYRLAMITKDSDIQRAVRLLEAAAAQKHGMANALLVEYRHVGMYVEKDLDRAIEHYETAVRSGVGNAVNNLSWLLATSTTQHADPARAVELIQPLAIYTGNWQYLDTLAAAHARLNHFELAEDIQDEAIRLLGAVDINNEQTDVLSDLQSRLSLYQREEPYLE